MTTPNLDAYKHFPIDEARRIFHGGSSRLPENTLNLNPQTSDEAETNGKLCEDAGLSGDEWFALADQMRREMGE